MSSRKGRGHICLISQYGSLCPWHLAQRLAKSRHSINVLPWKHTSVPFLEGTQGSFTILHLLSYVSPGALLLSWWKCPIAVLTSRVDTSHVPLLSICNVASATGGLTLIYFEFNFNSQCAIISASTVQEPEV